MVQEWLWWMLPFLELVGSGSFSWPSVLCSTAVDIMALDQAVWQQYADSMSA